MTLSDSTASDNLATEDAGIANTGTLTLIDDVISGNTGDGVEISGAGVSGVGEAMDGTDFAVGGTSGAAIFGPGGAAEAAGSGCVPVASLAGAGSGGDGGVGPATEKPARSCSSEYRALVRSAIRLWLSFSRSAAVIAREGGGGTVARLG